MKKPTRQEMIRRAQLCVAFNNANPIGCDVILLKDGGAQMRTKTRGEAYLCESGYPVIFLEGVSGYYLLDRVTPLGKNERLSTGDKK